MGVNDDKLSADDLALVKDIDSDAPEFLAGEELTAEEEAALEADRLGKTEEETGNAEEQAKAAEEAEAGLLKDDPAGKDGADSAPDPGEDDDDEPADKQGTVPHAALHKERKRRKEDNQRHEQKASALEAELAAMKEQMARGDERLKALTELFSGKKEDDKPKVEDDPEPDPETDIFAHNAWLRRQMGKIQERLARTDETLSEGQKQQQTRHEQDELVQSYQMDARQFLARQPDFRDAYQHLMQSRDRELAMLGIDDQKERARRIQEEELAIARSAIQKGRSPAELLYELAKERNWQPKAADPGAQAADGGAKPNGSAEASNGAAKADAKPSDAGKIDALKKGRDASMSLSNAGGSDAEVMTMAALADMNDEEFADYVEKHGGMKTVDQVLGR